MGEVCVCLRRRVWANQEMKLPTRMERECDTELSVMSSALGVWGERVSLCLLLSAAGVF